VIADLLRISARPGQRRQTAPDSPNVIATVPRCSVAATQPAAAAAAARRNGALRA